MLFADTHLLFVCGEICSGKGTFCRSIANYYDHIVVSDIVKEISGTSHRSQLTKTDSLDMQIADALIQRIDQTFLNGRRVAIDGIRQLSIYNRLKSEYSDIDMQAVWLNVPWYILRQRYAARADSKDDITFTHAMKKDAALGLTQLRERIINEPNNITLNHFEK